LQSPGLNNRLISLEQVLPLLMRRIVGVSDLVGCSGLSVQRHDHQLGLLILRATDVSIFFSGIVNLVG
jgi:hypothetical protein